LHLRVVGYEKGNMLTTDPKDRPAIDFRETVVSDAKSLGKKPAGAAEPAKAGEKK